MAAFPDDFSFENSEKTIKEKVLQCTEFRDAKDYVLVEHKKAIDRCAQWFMIDLSKYRATVREHLMKELLQKFPHVGCAAGPDPVLTMLSQIPGLAEEKVADLKKPLPMTRVNINKVDSDVTKYVVALTKEFADSMTRYTFPEQ